MGITKLIKVNKDELRKIIVSSIEIHGYEPAAAKIAQYVENMIELAYRDYETQYNMLNKYTKLCNEEKVNKYIIVFDKGRIQNYEYYSGLDSDGCITISYEECNVKIFDNEIEAYKELVKIASFNHQVSNAKVIIK